VAVAVLMAASGYAAGLFGRVRPFPPEALRLGLGRSLALALEFLLGADREHMRDLLAPARTAAVQPGVPTAGGNRSHGHGLPA
jgi:Protein of unknown function (DUF1622)